MLLKFIEAPLDTLAVNSSKTTGYIFGSSIYQAFTFVFDERIGIEISKGLDKST